MGDFCATVKLSEFFRDRYAVQREEFTHVNATETTAIMYLQDMALFGITDSLELVFHGCTGIIHRPPYPLPFV